EIARAARRMAAAVAAGKLAVSAVTADSLASFLDAPDLPDPDLIIRTSGEQRLSNFLLWQAAYSELVFVPTYWPDFDHAALAEAIAEYRRRERRFGGLAARTGSWSVAEAGHPPGSEPRVGELILRFASALVLVPLALVVAYVGGWLFAAFWGIAALGVLWEWMTLVAGHARHAVLAVASVAIVLAV